MTPEGDFKSKLIRRLRKMFPGCIILKNDANYLQGIPDLIILFNDRWALLEAKDSYNAPHQSNQDHYVTVCNDMSFAAFIYPENQEEVLSELSTALRSSW
jgi:hypothetical protein